MAGRRGMAHEDLRHFMGGVTAGEDLQVSKTKGIRPGLLRMLFAGGSVGRQLATDDTRHGRRENVKPGTKRMLFAGGDARDDELEPNDEEMLADGGEVADDLIIAAEDVMDALQGGAFYGDKINEGDSRVERASKEASRRAKAKILAQSLKAFFELCRD